MRFLVTGSSGFIGGHLLNALKQAEFDYVLFDLKDHSGDVRNKQQVRDKAQGCDGVFHLAAVASVQETIKDPEGTFAHNVIGTRNVFEIAKDLDIPVVYASSAAVYGDNQNFPLSEEEEPCPCSPYAEHKLQNELDAKALSIKSFGVRFFNIYGPGQDPSSPYSGVISIFHDRLKAGKAITVFGDGKQSRDFVYVADAVQALLLSMDNVSTKAPVSNVCTNVQNTLLQLADSLGVALGCKADICFEPARSGDIVHSLGNPEKLQKLTGFRPHTTLMEGIKSLVQESL